MILPIAYFSNTVDIFFSLLIQIREEKQARQAGMSEQSLFFLPNRALPLLIQGNSKTTRFLSS